jgi:hypothetical protein
VSEEIAGRVGAGLPIERRRVWCLWGCDGVRWRRSGVGRLKERGW